MVLGENQYGLLVVGAQAETPAATEIPSIMMAQGLDDETVLGCIAATASRKRCSLPEALEMLVAERILELQIPDGRNMVYPVSGVIGRMVWNTVQSTLPLEALAVNLRNAPDRHARLEAGLQLGDRATHFAAGFVGSRTLGRVMKVREQRNYAGNMAQWGYKAAFHAADQMRTRQTEPVRDAIPKILQRFRDVVSILAALPKKPVKDLTIS